MKGNPYKTWYVGRWCFGYWHGWRYWCWRPVRARFWSGKITRWRWLCFDLAYDSRTDVLGDWMHGVEENERRKAAEEGSDPVCHHTFSLASGCCRECGANRPPISQPAADPRRATDGVENATQEEGP